MKYRGPMVSPPFESYSPSGILAPRADLSIPSGPLHLMRSIHGDGNLVPTKSLGWRKVARKVDGPVQALSGTTRRTPRRLGVSNSAPQKNWNRQDEFTFFRRAGLQRRSATGVAAARTVQNAS